jgi:hypothetical protein
MQLARMVRNALGTLRLRASHIWMGGGEALGSGLEKLFEVFSGVVAPGHEDGDPSVVLDGDDSRGENPLARGLLVPLFDKGENPRGGIVVVEDVSIGGLTHERFIDGLNGFFGLIEDFPLGRGGNRHVEILLELLKPIEGRAAAVFQDGDHGRRAVVVFVLAALFGLGGLENLTAQVAAQSAELEDRRLKRGRADDSDEGRGHGQLVDLSLQTLGTRGAGCEARVVHFHQASPGVAVRPQPSVPLARLPGPLGVPGGLGLLRVAFGEDLPGCLGGSPKDVAEQPLDGGRVIVDNLLQMPDGLGYSLDERVVLLEEGPLLNPSEKLPHLAVRDLDALDLGVLVLGFFHGDGSFPFRFDAWCNDGCRIV